MLLLDIWLLVLLTMVIGFTMVFSWKKFLSVPIEVDDNSEELNTRIIELEAKVEKLMASSGIKNLY